MSFEAVHQEFHARVLRYMRRFAAEDEANDLAQVVMMKVSAALPGFRGDSSLATWIYRIATRVGIDHLRRKDGQSALEEPELPEADRADEDPEEAVAQPTPSTESTAIRQEMSACVRDFVDRLPENYRIVLVLSELEGFTNPEIARITGLSLETVKIRLHRARARLRNDLEKGCSFDRDEDDGLACDRKAPAPPPAGER